MIRNSIAALAFLALTHPVLAEEVSIGTLKISDVVVQQTGPAQLFGTASMKIENTGNRDDHLVAVIAEFADGAFQIREVDDGGFAKQVIVDDGVPIEAGQTTILSPDGFQIAFLNLKMRLMGGDVHPVTLRFQEAGEVTLRITVRGLGGDG